MSVTLHTSFGDIKIEIFCDAVPKTAQNFLALCASGYYNNNNFHRVIKGFMIQTGDPTGTGKGGTSIWGRKFENEIRPYLRHDAPGIVSMANNGPDSNLSQFFIISDKQPHLDNKYTVFGKVIHGLDVVERIERAPVNEKNRPLKEIKIDHVTIHANPLTENI